VNESAMPILEANSRFVAAFHFQPQDVSIVSVSARLISNERCGCSAGSASRSKFVTDLHVLIAYWEKRERGVVFSRPLRALRAA